MTPEPTAADRTVDTLGRPCPIPVVELAKAVDELPVGGRVELLSDDPASKVDVPVWCRMQRQTFVHRRERPDGGWSYLVEKAR